MLVCWGDFEEIMHEFIIMLSGSAIAMSNKISQNDKKYNLWTRHSCKCYIVDFDFLHFASCPLWHSFLILVSYTWISPIKGDRYKFWTWEFGFFFPSYICAYCYMILDVLNSSYFLTSIISIPSIVIWVFFFTRVDFG